MQKKSFLVIRDRRVDSVTIDLNQFDIYWFWYFSQLNSNGCITQQVHTKMLQITNTAFEMKLRVEARIREEGTGVSNERIWEIKQ